MKNTVRVQDDLYNYVNGKKLKELKIPGDRPIAGGFSELADNVEKTLRADFKKFKRKEKEVEIPQVKEAIKLYNKVLNIAKRNKDGIKPLLPYLNKILEIKNIDDLNKRSKDLLLNGIDLPINIGVEPDMGNASKNSFVIVGPSLILPDTSYYQEGNQAGVFLLNVYKQMITVLLKYTDLSDEEQNEFIIDALEFDKAVSKVVKSQVEWANYVDNYHPFPLEKVQKLLYPYDLKHLLNDLYGRLPSQIIVSDPKAIKEFNSYFNEGDLKKYLHWAYVRCLVSASKYLSKELRSIATSYQKTLIGVQKDPTLEKQAYQLTSKFFSEPIGVYYGKTYFGEEAKEDVTNITNQIISMYIERMKTNYFLDNETKEKAINKLSKIKVKIGYPDKIEKVYDELKVNSRLSLLDNIVNLSRVRILDQLNDLYKDVDNSKWAMPAHLVNACYNPFANDITFPAAILQKPFYSLEQSVSQNLGGIGAVIGHEISHAFDNNGAHFDEKGNISNWWKEEDFKKFDELTKRMIKQFDGIDFHGGKVNGELIVSENIADNGGMAVTIAIMNTLKEKNFQEYFMNWARIWCLKARPEYTQLLLVSDVHAPAELRANMTPRNFNEWYSAFDVKESDKLFIDEDNRINIW